MSTSQAKTIAFFSKEELISSEVDPHHTITLGFPVEKEDFEDSECSFSITGILGVGGMGEVLLAQETCPRREVALKKAKNNKSSYMNAIKHEAMIMGSLEHPNIIPVHRVMNSEEHGFCMVMKKVAGEGLDARKDSFGDPTWFKTGVSILIHVCHALEYAHDRGIIHRDVKPDNIMMGSFGEVYLLDWGTALDITDLHKARKSILGTPAYMAPEMLSGNPTKIGVWTDVYLLGATLHEILTKEKRHRGETLEQVLQAVERSSPYSYSSSVPRSLAQLANHACQHVPEERPPTVKAFRESLELFISQWEGYHIFEDAQKTAKFFAQEESAEARMGHFFAARFGFEQVLRIIPHHKESKKELSILLHSMIAWQIERGNIDMAEGILLSLHNPSQEIISLVQKARYEQDQMRKKQEELESIAREHDKSGSQRERMIMMSTVSAVCVLTMIAVMIYDTIYNPIITPQRLIFTMGGIALVTSLAVFLGRKQLLANAVGRRISISLWLGTLGFPLVVVSSFVHLPSQDEGMVANFIMSIHLLIVSLTFALVHPAIRTGAAISGGALSLFFATLLFPNWTHAALLGSGCIAAAGLIFDWVIEKKEAETA